jgi:hypothetical protein
MVLASSHLNIMARWNCTFFRAYRLINSIDTLRRIADKVNAIAANTKECCQTGLYRALLGEHRDLTLKNSVSTYKKNKHETSL